MGQVSTFLRRVQGGFAHWCPACEEMHRLPDGWIFNGNLERPTFTPSFKHTGVQSEVKDGKWTGEYIRDSAGKPLPWCCHYILTDGMLDFCSDCTHNLRGRVPLPPLPADYQD